MRKVMGWILFCIGFVFLLAAGSAVDSATGSAFQVMQRCTVGLLMCAGSVILLNWECI